jgi:predicted transcriptional regulator YheO
MNWNSKQKEHTKLVKIETIATAEHCKHLKSIGHSVVEIANRLNLSKARIYEYLKYKESDEV